MVPDSVQICKQFVWGLVTRSIRVKKQTPPRSLTPGVNQTLAVDLDFKMLLP